jgi:hypothetical protein
MVQREMEVLFVLTEHHFAAVAYTITPEDGRIRPKHVELYNTCNKSYTLVASSWILIYLMIMMHGYINLKPSSYFD